MTFTSGEERAAWIRFAAAAIRPRGYVDAKNEIGIAAAEADMMLNELRRRCPSNPNFGEPEP